MEKANFSAIIRKEEDMFVTECPEVGTVSQGRTIEESIANVKNNTINCIVCLVLEHPKNRFCFLTN